jgi:hypothetical protein
LSSNNRATFEKYIMQQKTKKQLTGKEATDIIKHFKKEIYPLDNKTIVWMWKNLGREEVNFYTKFKEIKKLVNGMQKM